MILCLALFMGIHSASAADLPAGVFVDIDGTNTAALGGTPSPFFTDSPTDAGFTTGALWRRRTGFGFTANGAREIFEKDANGGIGNAASLVTTVTGLVPGASYGVYVAFLSTSTESWQVKAGLSSDTLSLFTPTAPAGRVTSYGLSGESGSNRVQYLGFVGNAQADSAGTLLLYADDGNGTATSGATRSWLEGFLLGQPVDLPPPPAGASVIAPDGAWTWFNDERAIVHRGSLFSGYVLSDGRYGVTRYDFSDGKSYPMIISTGASQQRDDHNNPSLTILPDGRILAVYSKHSSTSAFYTRTSTVSRPATSADWGAEVTRAVPAANSYSNTFRLPAENNAIYNFHRCINYNPTLTVSTDGGATWGSPRRVIATGTGATRPYPRYVSNDLDQVDLLYTDGHPRDSDNSIYHLVYKAGVFSRTDGSMVKSLANIPLDHDAGERGSVVYPYSAASWGPGQGPDDWIPTARAWGWDIHYDRDAHPVCVFQTQTGTDATWSTSRIYYYYARWTGTQWQRRFIAQGGRGLYAAESDYGGGMCLDPADPRIVYISTNAANPFAISDVANVPLAAGARFEIWRGFTADGGLTFTWTPLTQNSAANNLRPIVPKNHGRTECVLWFYGSYTSYTDFSCQVVGRLGDPATSYVDWAATYPLGAAVGPGDDPDADGLPNLLEYALSGTPTDPAFMPRLVFDGVTFELPFDPTRPDVELAVQRSTDLRQWQSVAVIRAGFLPSSADVGYTLGIPVTPGTARVFLPSESPATPVFFRLSAKSTR